MWAIHVYKSSRFEYLLIYVSPMLNGGKTGVLSCSYMLKSLLGI